MESSPKGEEHSTHRLADRMKELNVPGAMACLRLVQEGELALDTEVNTYLTSRKFPGDPAAQGKPITLRELLVLLHRHSRRLRLRQGRAG
jgi:hypothetical protein